MQWKIEDATRVLVLQAPNKAVVKLTNAEELYTAEIIACDAPEWIKKQTQLKGQLINMCHDTRVPYP